MVKVCRHPGRALGSLLNSLDHWRLLAQHEVQWRVRRLRGVSGDFAVPEHSQRATDLTSAWTRQWPGSEPVRWMLPAEHDRSVRFHSLPDGKRYPESEGEYREVVRRQRAILDVLRGGEALDSLVVIAVDWGARDLESGTSRMQLHEPWPWRIGKDPCDPDAPPVYFWVQLGVESDELDRLLRSTADDAGRFVLSNREMSWLICPYDGGVDIVLPSATERCALEERFPEWLPDGWFQDL